MHAIVALFQPIDRVGWANFTFFFKKSLLENQPYGKMKGNQST